MDESHYPDDFPFIEIPFSHLEEDIYPINREKLGDTLETYAQMLREAISEKSVKKEGKQLIYCIAAQIETLGASLINDEDVPQVITNNGPPTATQGNNSNNDNDLKQDILQCVKKELANHLTAVNSIKEEIAALQREQVKSTYAAVASAAASAIAPTTVGRPTPYKTAQTRDAPRSSPPISRPAIIVTPTTEAKTKEESIIAFKKAISFRDAKYAPAKVQTISKGKLRVEFDSTEQRDDALNRLRTAKSVSAEPARRLLPMVILKGVTCDIPAEELPSIIRNQNPDIIMDDSDLCLRFKRNNRNPALYNAVLTACPSTWRRITEAGRICVDHQRVHVEDFSPFLQCFRCLQFGHTKAKCNSTNTACAHCASLEHTVDSCPNKEKPEKPKCLNCINHNTRFGSKIDANHKATTPTCPRLKSMRERIGQRVDYGPLPGPLRT